MSNALLEIGCEEIPARFMPGLLEDLRSKAIEKLTRERIAFGPVETLGTYRRLVLYLEDVSPRQADMIEEIQGPPAEIAFDKDNKPTQAAIGFAKKYKIKLDFLKIKTVGNKNYVFVSVVRKGQLTSKVLTTLFPEIIESLYLPLSMRWGDLDFKFIRPIHWILALCGRKVIKFELAGIKSGNKTSSHRYRKRNVGTTLVVVRLFGQGQALSLHSYKQQLLKLGVMVDQNERKEAIRKKVEAAAKKIEASALIEEDLLNEVNYLIEDPQVYVGKFDKSFLDLPQEILITSMKKNQKYFAFVDAQKKPLSRFIVAADGCRNPKIVEGNARVLSARLSDAKFFFEEDKKIPFFSRTAKLENIAYFEKLGTVYHKTERLIKLAQWISKKLGGDEEELKKVKRIAELCKLDLTTKMVYEFPELQGVMGKIYAQISGEDKIVSQGIFEHYLPRFAEDSLPSLKEAMAVGLADRFDTLVGCFSLGYFPSGSEDPFGLRRTVLGIIRLLFEKELTLLWDEVISESYRFYEPVFLGYLLAKGETGYQDFSRIKKEILTFARGRLSLILLEQSIRHDVVEAVLSTFNDVLEAQKKALVLQKVIKETWILGLVRSQDRIARIVGSPPREQVIVGDLIEEEEKKLHELYLRINWEVGEALSTFDYGKALKALSKLTEPLEVFFEKVLVMHGEEKLKFNRLALLKSLEKLYLQVADFRKIVL